MLFCPTFWARSSGPCLVNVSHFSSNFILKALVSFFNQNSVNFQQRNFSPKRKFLAGYPCGHPAKNFGQALQILEEEAFCTEIPRGRPQKNFGLKNFGLIFRSIKFSQFYFQVRSTLTRSHDKSAGMFYRQEGGWGKTTPNKCSLFSLWDAWAERRD